jgi:hypothetical protein
MNKFFREGFSTVKNIRFERNPFINPEHRAEQPQYPAEKTISNGTGIRMKTIGNPEANPFINPEYRADESK